jgi:hypothetical protein
MELASLFLLILLPPADATGDTATAVTASLRRELGDVTMAIAPDTLVTPAMWQGEKAPMRARFVVHLVWKKNTASIEVFSPSSANHGKDSAGFRRNRELSFAEQDSKVERGRAIGLVVAEMLRESPAAALATAGPAVDKAVADPGSASHLVLGGLFAVERVRSGNWAMGPALTYGFGLGDALRLQVSGFARFGSADQYVGIGADAGVFWDLLPFEHGRHALGIGLAAGLLCESATAAGEADGQSASTWNLVVGPSLGGRMTVWRRLRIVGEVGLRATSGTMRLTAGEESDRTQLTFSRWRPVFALGLAFAL